MFKSAQILFKAFVLAASTLNLAGCGQTGALYLPPAPQTPAQVAPSVSAQPSH